MSSDPVGNRTNTEQVTGRSTPHTPLDCSGAQQAIESLQAEVERLRLVVGLMDLWVCMACAQICRKTQGGMVLLGPSEIKEVFQDRENVVRTLTYTVDALQSDLRDARSEARLGGW